MSDETKLIHGTGNIFRDIGVDEPKAKMMNLKARLVAEIILALKQHNITDVKAAELTGFNAADFSRIRRYKLERFSVGRLAEMLMRLDPTTELDIRRGAKFDASDVSAMATA